MDRLKPTAALRRVQVVVGVLRRVTPESLSFAYEALTRDTLAAGSLLDIKVEPFTVLCRDCGWQGQIDDAVPLCAGCGAGKLQTLKGMELFLAGLEVEDNETAEK